MLVYQGHVILKNYKLHLKLLHMKDIKQFLKQKKH